MNFLTIFIISNVINVTLSTIKSIATVKGGKTVAAIANALAYGFYTLIIVLTAQTDEGLSTMEKAFIVGACNLVCVWLVKYVEEKKRKDKLWLVKVTIPKENIEKIKLELADVPFTYFDLDKYYVLDCFCERQSDTKKVLELCKRYGGKAFATENKLF